MSNGMAVDKEIVNKLKEEIICKVRENIRTEGLTNIQMVKQIQKMIEEEVECNSKK